MQRIYRTAFYLLLQDAYAANIDDNDVNLKAGELDAPYTVWPLDHREGRLCGGSYECKASYEIPWGEYPTQMEKTMLHSFR